MRQAKSNGKAALTALARSFEAGRDREPDDREIDRWVLELRKRVVGGQVELMASVGDFLIDRVYGSPEEAMSRRSGKHATMGRILDRADEIGMARALLVRAVPFAIQVRQLGRGLALRLGMQQHRALLPVKDAGEKKLLAEAAAAAGWSAEELKRKVRRVKRPQPGGRPPEPELRVFVRRLSRVVAEAAPARLKDGRVALAPGEARKILAEINRAQAVLERLEKLVTRSL